MLCILYLGLCLALAACGDDSDLGTSRTDDGLRIGSDGPSLRLGTGSETGGSVSDTRQIEETVVIGNIFNIRPATARPIFAFAFINLRDPTHFRDYDDAEVIQVPADRAFLIPNLASGSLTLVFLLDEVGVNLDGSINVSDPIAVFEDPNGTLHNLSARTQVELVDIDVNFDLEHTNAGTAQVQSAANIIITQRPFEAEGQQLE